MPAPATVDEFLDLIRKSGVVEDNRLASYLEKFKSGSSTIPTDTSKLAGLMVRDGLLTYFQAEQFLQGKWKRFTIGKYKVLERLGVGGMGQVFLCEHKLMRRRVALKVLPTAKAEDPSSLDRFYREARAVAALDHPNIVRAYDIDQDDNLHFLVMEYVDGASLHDILKKTRQMDVLRASHYIYWSAIGLQHAHEQGIIHRDIKPGNILVDRQGVVKILDMGLARFFNDETDHITKKYDENVLGTADYLAPEQALDSHSVDGRADIYSLGATFYFLLTGNPPFADGTVAQKLIWHQNREPKPIKLFRGDVPEGIINIVNKMMAKNPADRFQSPNEIAAILGPWIQTPIPPPPEEEMPQLCAAVLASGTGTSPSTGKGSTITNMPTIANNRRNSNSGMQLAPIPTPPLNKSSSTHPALGNPQLNTPPNTKNQSTQSKGSVKTSGSDQVWESLHETNSVGRSDTGSHRSAKRKDTKPPSSKRKSRKDIKPITLSSKKKWIIGGAVGGIVLLLAIILILVLSNSGPKTNPNDPKNVEPAGPRKISVTRNQPAAPKDNRFQSVQLAIENARPGDRIVIADEEWDEVVMITQAKKDLTIEGEEGKQVVWKTTADSASNIKAVLEIGNAENLHLRNIIFNANHLKENALRITGKCPGMILDDVEFHEAQTAAVKFLNCNGESNRPVVMKNFRIVTSTKTPLTEVGISFAGISSKNTILDNQAIEIQNGRWEGHFSVAAIKIEGQIQDVEFKQNRILNAAVGVFIARTTPQQVISFKLTNNTFHTIGAAIRFEAARVLADPATKKYTIDVQRNYFVNVTGGLIATEDKAPIPSISNNNNARTSSTPDARPHLTTFVLDGITLSMDPKEEKNFLKNDQLLHAGPKGIPIGYTGQR
jgi:eukaryotic-like serine/threonine-protein kinase